MKLKKCLKNFVSAVLLSVLTHSAFTFAKSKSCKSLGLSKGDEAKCKFDKMFRLLGTERCLPGYDPKKEQGFLVTGAVCAAKGVSDMQCFASCFLMESGIIEEKKSGKDKKNEPSEDHQKKQNPENHPKDHQKQNHAKEKAKMHGRGRTMSNRTEEDLNLEEDVNPTTEGGEQLIRQKRENDELFDEVKNDIESVEEEQPQEQIKPEDDSLLDDAVTPHTIIQGRGFHNPQKPGHKNGPAAGHIQQGRQQNEIHPPDHKQDHNKNPKSHKETDAKSDPNEKTKPRIRLNKKRMNEKIKLLFPGFLGDELAIQKIRTGLIKCVKEHPDLLPTNYFGDCSSVQGLMQCIIEVLGCFN